MTTTETLDKVQTQAELEKVIQQELNAIQSIVEAFTD